MNTQLRVPLVMILSMLCCLTFSFDGYGQIISQYTETNSGGTPKGIEIWNNTAATLDFSVNNLEIHQGTNGAFPTPLVTVNTGTLASGEVMVIGTADIGTYLTNQGLTGVLYVSQGFMFNGDDSLVVLFGGVITDVFGEPGVDPPGVGWTGNGVSTANQNIQLLSGITTGDLVGWTDPSLRFETVSTNPVADLTGFGIAPLPAGAPLLSVSTSSITNLDYIINNGPSASQTFDVSGINLDPSSGSINVSTPTDFEVSLDDTNYSNNVFINYTGGAFSDETIYVRLKENMAGGLFSGDILIEGGTAPDAFVAVAGTVEAPNFTTLPYNQPFDTDLGDTYVYNVSGTTTWVQNTGAALANGYGGQNPEEQWLVLPGIDFSIYNDVLMTFNTTAQYGAIDADNYLKLYYSTDYIGVGDPTTATWTELSFDLPASVSSTPVTTPSGIIELSAITASDVFIAFKYFATSDPTSWRIDDIDIMEATALINVSSNTISGLDYTETNGPSASQSVDVNAIGLSPTSGNLTITAPANFEVSTDDLSFSASVNMAYLNGELATTPVYVRLQSGLPINTYSGDVFITGGGANQVDVAVSGEVSINYNGMETFENFPETGNSYATGSFAGLNNNTWNYVDARGDHTINAETVTLRNNTTASLNSSIPGGISGFSFDYKQAFSTNVNLEVYINGTLEATVTTSGEAGVNKNSGFITLPTPAYGTFQIEFKQGTDGGQVAIDNFNWVEAIPDADYTWENGAWSPQTPLGNATVADDILIVNGTAVFDADIELNNLYVLNGASLEVEHIMSVNGDILNDGDIVFMSNSTNTAQLDTFNGANTGIGMVTVERYIPARRAFRLLSSPVSTTGSIHANWQEGVNNPDTATNLDPNPGYGTHITGSQTGVNGFDASPSGNPSLFMLDNAAQSWNAVTNTDSNTLTAGTPYRLMVRGSRSIDVTSNSATPTNTVLRSSGSLYTGPYTTTDFNETAGAFNFFGNPYQAQVSMNDVISASININDAHYYIWDPAMNARGGYVTVDLPAGTNSLGSEADGYLQPGQAAFVTTLADGAASLHFEESHKAVSQPQTQVFSADSKLDLRLYTAAALAQNETVADAVRIKFGSDYSNAVTPQDAAKFYNLDENLATTNNGSLLSIERRAIPIVGEQIPLFINQYRTTHYVFEAQLTEVGDVQAVLVDHFSGTSTALENNDSTLYAFEVDANNPASKADNRFEIVFDVLLNTGEAAFGNDFVLFPNPAQSELHIATRGIAGEEMQLCVTGITGQTVYENTITVNNDGHLTLDTSGMGTGVYILKLTNAQGGQFTAKFVKQ